MRRTISCYSNCYGPAGVRVAAEQLALAGLSNIELALRGHNFGGLVIPESVLITEKSRFDEIVEFRNQLKSLQMSISGCNVGGADLRTTEGFELTARRILFMTNWFSNTPLAVTGASQPTDAAERRIVVDHLKRLGDYAEACEVVLALETHKGPTQNAAAMLELMNEVNHPRVLLNFDTGNIAFYNEGMDPVEELKQVKHLVRSVHLKDNRGGFEDWYFPALGDGGAVDFVKIRQELDSVGFQGPYTIEIEGIGGEPEPGLDTRQERVVRSVAHLRKCGYFDQPSGATT